MSNPLGIEPCGNSFFTKTSRKQSLNCFRTLPDNLLLDLFYRIGPFCAAKLLQTTKDLYPFGMEDSIWRQFSIDKTNGNGFQFRKTWKNTFKLLIKNDNYVEDSPIKIENFYSDYLYHSWRCSTIDLEELTRPEICNIDKRSNLTVQEFLKEYAIPQIPVIITDAIENWEAYKKWDFNFFLNRQTSSPYTAESVQMSFHDYYNYMTTTIEESPLYLFDKKVLHDPDMKSSFSIPPYFSQSLFNLLPSPPDNTWLIIGPKRSGSTFHIDPNSTCAWNACLKGRKKWVLYPRGISPPGVYALRDGSEVTSPVSIVEWFMNHYQNLDPMLVKEAIVNEGEIMYIPQQWWHGVINLDDSIAVTQNFVASYNLVDVLGFCKYKGEQVSGYNGASLHEDFVKVLKECEPAIVEGLDPRLLEPKVERKRRWDVMVEETTEFSFDFHGGSDEQEDQKEE